MTDKTSDKANAARQRRYMEKLKSPIEATEQKEREPAKERIKELARYAERRTRAWSDPPHFHE